MLGVRWVETKDERQLGETTIEDDSFWISAGSLCLRA